MKITENRILKDYEKLKLLAYLSLQKDSYHSAEMFLKKAALLMYEVNLFYKDDELENIMLNFSKKIFKNMNTVKTTRKKRLIFYDYFVMDNRGLTEQYIEALSCSDYVVLYIAGRYKDSVSFEIYKKLETYKNVIIYPFVLNVDNLRVLYDKITDFSPEIIIAHTAPWDICGLMLITALGYCKKYLINITDHAFWLGHTVFDYYFEFRDYGYNISQKFRYINKKHLLKLPYYPIVNKNIPFQGFDFNSENKKIVFSGGSVYKIEGSPVFFEIVKYILDNHQDTIFLYLGGGDISSIQNFILENKYNERFFIYPERKDIYEVFCHTYLYINTYPLIGGLMTQLACISGIAPLTLQKDIGDHVNDVNELFLCKPSFPILFADKHKLLESIDRYLNDPEAYRHYCKTLDDLIISKDKFNNLLLDYLEEPINQLSVNIYDINIDIFSQDYITRLNINYGLKYYRLFLAKHKSILFHFLPYLIKFIILKSIILYKNAINKIQRGINMFAPPPINR